MSGGDAIRGFFVQTLVALLDALQSDDEWETVTLEPSVSSEKIDVLWKGSHGTRAVQIKSSTNQMNKPDVEKWAGELESSTDATDYELVLLGPCSASVAKLGRVGRVIVRDPQPLDVKGLIQRAAHCLDIYLTSEEFPHLGPGFREVLVLALLGKLEKLSIDGTTISRTELTQLLAEWINAFDNEHWSKSSIGDDAGKLMASKLQWWHSQIVGSDYGLEQGIAGTRILPNGHHASLFPLDTTVILGDSGKDPPFNPSKQTVAHWSLPTSDFPIEDYVRGYLLIGCIRQFGGLHSPTYDDRVQILLNDSTVDGFELKHRPEGHVDCFHQMTYPDAPTVPPFSECYNVYAWFIPKSHLQTNDTQALTIVLDADTKWDIDYLGFLFEVPKG